MWTDQSIFLWRRVVYHHAISRNDRMLGSPTLAAENVENFETARGYVLEPINGPKIFWKLDFDVGQPAPAEPLIERRIPAEIFVSPPVVGHDVRHLDCRQFE